MKAPHPQPSSAHQVGRTPRTQTCANIRSDLGPPSPPCPCLHAQVSLPLRASQERPHNARTHARTHLGLESSLGLHQSVNMGSLSTPGCQGLLGAGLGACPAVGQRPLGGSDQCGPAKCGSGGWGWGVRLRSPGRPRKEKGCSREEGRREPRTIRPVGLEGRWSSYTVGFQAGSDLLFGKNPAA